MSRSLVRATWVAPSTRYWLRGGASINHISRTDAQAEITGDVVILAVPCSALKEIIERYGEQLAGKVVVDITNPLDFATFDSLVVPSASSAAPELAAALPAPRVVKALQHLRRRLAVQVDRAESNGRSDGRRGRRRERRLDRGRPGRRR